MKNEIPEQIWNRLGQAEEHSDSFLSVYVDLNLAQIGPNEVPVFILGSTASQCPMYHSTPEVETACIFIAVLASKRTKTPIS